MRKALYILGSLDDGDIDWLASSGERILIKSGDLLIREGCPIEHLYILLEGQLSVRAGTKSENEIAILRPGEIVGEISFVDHRKPTASVFASYDSRLLALSRTELNMRLSKDVAFASRFYRAVAVFLADRLFVTTSRLGYGDPAQDNSGSEIENPLMEEISLAAIRFDKLLRFLGSERRAGSFAADSN